jgi:hypothetical protein
LNIRGKSASSGAATVGVALDLKTPADAIAAQLCPAWTARIGGAGEGADAGPGDRLDAAVQQTEFPPFRSDRPDRAAPLARTRPSHRLSNLDHHHFPNFLDRAFGRRILENTEFLILAAG